MRTEFLEAYTLLPLTDRCYAYHEIPGDRDDSWWSRGDVGFGSFKDRRVALACLPRPALVCVLYMDPAARKILSREWLFLD